MSTEDRVSILPRRETKERTQEYEPKKIKKWTPDEDAKMLDLVKEFGTRHVRLFVYMYFINTS